MPHDAPDYPHTTREERHFEVSETFIKTSARYLDVDQPMPGRYVSPQPGKQAAVEPVS
jgi:hypothetical protein